MKYVLWFCLLLGSFSNAHALSVQGVLAQGGFVLGKTQPFSTVTLEKEQVKADAEGYFVIGLHRNFPVEATLKAVAPNGEQAQQALIVTPRSYETQKITGVPDRVVNPFEKDMPRIQKESAAIKAARQEATAALPYFATRFISPVKDYRVSGVYGSRRVFNGEERSWHKGHDMAAPTGTPVYAPADGVVRLALPDSFFNGNLIILDHGYRLMTLYAHLDTMQVKEGETVKQGDLLGTVGTTGRSTGPHLHWGLSWGSMALDPAFLLEGDFTAWR